MKKALYIGTGFLIGIVFSAAIAYIFGPRTETAHIDLYTGHERIVESLFWHSWEVHLPEQEHTKWAREHKESKTWARYVPGGSCHRFWFSGGLDAATMHQDIVRSIFESSFTPDEKVRLLREYHSDLDSLDPDEPYRKLYEKWNQQLAGRPGQTGAFRDSDRADICEIVFRRLPNQVLSNRSDLPPSMGRFGSP